MTTEQQQSIQDKTHRISELCGQMIHGRILFTSFLSAIKEIYTLNVEISRAIQEAHTI